MQQGFLILQIVDSLLLKSFLSCQSESGIKRDKKTNSSIKVGVSILSCFGNIMYLFGLLRFHWQQYSKGFK